MPGSLEMAWRNVRTLLQAISKMPAGIHAYARPNPAGASWLGPFPTEEG